MKNRGKEVILIRNISIIILLICLLLSSRLIIAQTVFEINDFQAVSENVELEGDAKFHDRFLRLTPSKPEQLGAVWYTKEKIDLDKGFNTDFEFRISENDSKYHGGDGFAFVIQNQGENVAAGTGDNMGYKKIAYALAIEIDTYNNKDEDSKNHICLSFYDEDKGEYNRYATVHEIPEVNDGKSHYARVEYVNNRLVFFLDSYIFPILSVKIDIKDKIKSPEGLAYVGFTSATSFASSNHDLIAWKMNKFVDPPQLVDVEDRIINLDKEVEVSNRNIKIAIWDDNLIDGDTISIRIDDKWILTNYGVQKDKMIIDYTLTGFENKLVIYAHNIGKLPPNTAAVSVDDGNNRRQLTLKSDLHVSEAIILKYREREKEEK